MWNKRLSRSRDRRGGLERNMAALSKRNTNCGHQPTLKASLYCLLPPLLNSITVMFKGSFSYNLYSAKSRSQNTYLFPITRNLPDGIALVTGMITLLTVILPTEVSTVNILWCREGHCDPWPHCQSGENKITVKGNNVYWDQIWG